jgi:glutathione S-transferase
VPPIRRVVVTSPVLAQQPGKTQDRSPRGKIMKLYYHPVSTSCRTIMLFAAENGVDLELRLVDLMKGEHLREPYGAINPNRLVPLLEDDGFRLTESSAILKYLADKTGSATYPKDLRKRARVNERMDWINCNFYRDFGYGLCYPQLFPNHRRANDAVQAATIAWGKEKSKTWLKILDEHIIGPSQKFLCGDEITIADHFGAPIVTLGEAIRCNFSLYPNLTRWLGNMKALRSWSKVNEAFYGLVGSIREVSFEAV